MSKDLNLCQFIGRLGQDVDLKYTPSGTAVANLSLACGDDYKDKNGQKVEQTNWIRVVMWGRLAEVAAEYLSKGSQVYVSGKQVTRKWQAKDNTDRYTTEIVADNMQMLGSGSGASRSDQGTSNDQSQASAHGGGSSESATPDDEPFTDKIPF